MINCETTPWVFPEGWGFKVEDEFTAEEQSVSGAKTRDVPNFSDLSASSSNLPEGTFMSGTGTDSIAGTTHDSWTPECVRYENVDQGLTAWQKIHVLNNSCSSVSNIYRDAMQTVNSFPSGGNEQICEIQNLYNQNSRSSSQDENNIVLLNAINRNEDENKQKYVTQELVCDRNLVKYHDSDMLKDVKILREVRVSDSKNDNVIIPSQTNVTVSKICRQKHITQELVSQRKRVLSEKGNVKHENSLHEEQQIPITQELVSRWNRILSKQGNFEQESSFHEEMIVDSDCENKEPLKEHKDLAIFYFEDTLEQQSSDPQNTEGDRVCSPYVDNVQPVSPRIERCNERPSFLSRRNASPRSQNFSSGVTQSTCGLLSYPPVPPTTSQAFHNELPRLPLLNKYSHYKYSCFANNNSRSLHQKSCGLTEEHTDGLRFREAFLLGETMSVKTLFPHPQISPSSQQYPLRHILPSGISPTSSQTHYHSSSNNYYPQTFPWSQQSSQRNKVSGETSQNYVQINNHSSLFHLPTSPRPRQSLQGDRLTDEIPQISYQPNNHSSSNNAKPLSGTTAQSSFQANDESSSQGNGNCLPQVNDKSLSQVSDKSSPQPNDESLPLTNDTFSVANRTSLSMPNDRVIESELMAQERSGRNEPYTNSFCPAPANPQKNLEEHIQRHTNDANGNSVEEKLNIQGCSGKNKPHKCPFCHRRVQSQSSLERHVLRHTSEKQVTCPHCPFRCFDTTGLNSHLISHSDERPFACPQCPKKWKRRNDVEKHVRRAHTNARPFLCGHCSATYKDGRDLRRHMISHTTERPYACPQCPATFKAPDNRRQHMKTHSRERPFVCAHCPAKFGLRTSLQLHIKVHMGDKPYSCEHCPARFKWSGGLTQHMATHGERKLECAHCSARFRHKNNLKAHMKIHTGEKPHACTKCPARFREISTLKHHLKAHLNERKFTCAHCSEGFRYKGRLQKHLETHCSKQLRVKKITLRLTDNIKVTCVV